jgi:hypothetical protein
MRRVVSQMRDHANVSPTALAVSPDGSYLSTGSMAGVVNVYQRHSSNPAAGGLSTSAGVPLRAPPALGGAVTNGKPLKEIMNLTTAVDTLVFSHDSQVGGSYKCIVCCLGCICIGLFGYLYSHDSQVGGSSKCMVVLFKLYLYRSVQVSVQP